MKENYQRAIELKAKELHDQKLERYQVVLALTKVFGSKAVSEWLELDAKERTHEQPK